MPFKEAVIPLLDRLAPSAKAIDSVNTIVNDDGVLTGHNTDYGAVVDLVADIDPAMPFLLRGSGGMAKAVAAALSDSGFRSGRVAARNAAAGRRLAELYSYEWMSEPEGNTPLLVNVTPLGMTGPDAEMLAFPEEMIAACEIAFDVVQYPARTPFLRLAAEAGKRCIAGAEVATLQALQQFVLYTGVAPDSAQVAEATHWARANA
jgi:shikimate dehydrogenase